MDWQAEAWDDVLFNPERYDDPCYGVGPPRYTDKTYFIEEVVKETGKGLLVRLPKHLEPMWFPKSHTRLHSYKGREALEINGWLVLEKNLAWKGLEEVTKHE